MSEVSRDRHGPESHECSMPKWWLAGWVMVCVPPGSTPAAMTGGRRHILIKASQNLQPGLTSPEGPEAK